MRKLRLYTDIETLTEVRTVPMRAIAIAFSILCAVSVLDAHVTVIPRQSQAGADQRYTIRVPTEGQIATTSVELEVPVGLVVTEVVPGVGYTFEVRRDGDRIVAITWKREIPPKQAAQFEFLARNPQSDQLVWKAHQRFADGTTADWIGVAGDRRPASITKLTVTK
jgi:uncharacterized protein YcnI